MDKSCLFAAVPLALALPAGALANDDKMRSDSSMNSDAVETLKSSLPSTQGFEVDDMRTGDDGVACITYRVANDQNGQSRVRAVVEGDKVLRETTGNTRFAKAWNSKCVASR
jgi:hypothetical protein